MTQAFAVIEQIEAPPDQVWAVLTDWRRAPEWMPGIEHLSASGATEVGTTLTFRARGKERPSEVTALTVGQSINLRSIQGPVQADYTYSCRPSGGGTSVTLDADCQISGIIGLFAPLIRFAIARSDSPQLSNLKRLIESEL